MNGQSATLERALEALAEVCRIEPPSQPPVLRGHTGTLASEPAVTTKQMSRLPENPADYAEDFHKWAINDCGFQDRRFSTIAALFEGWCEWAAIHSVPCHRDTFEQLLRDAGFLIVDGWVSGLCLARWLAAAERSRSEPSPASRRDGEFPKSAPIAEAQQFTSPGTAQIGR